MDGPPAVALGVENAFQHVDRPPRPVDESLPNMELLLIFYLGGIMVLGTLIVYYLALKTEQKNIQGQCVSVFSSFSIIQCNKL